MSNERITEKITLKLLSKAGITEENGFLIEEQKSQNPRIQKCLKSASKSGKGIGKPEFLITKKDNKEFLIVIECKAQIKNHISDTKDRYVDFAVDGALLYSNHLSKEFHIISIGISGQNEKELKINTFIQPKNSLIAQPFLDTNKAEITKILPWKKYIEYATYDSSLAEAKHSVLKKFSRELHNYMRDYAKITEAQKPLLVSGILLALMEKGFEESYKYYENEDLAKKTFGALKETIEKATLGENQEVKKKAIINAFSFIQHHPELHKFNKKENESPLFHIIKELHEHVEPFTKHHYDFDIIGDFYGEFIRYTGGDKQGLGIVLTPKHITELFSDLAKLNENSVVLDICAGTAGFLISAMKKMINGVSEDKKQEILKHNLIGIEQEPQMFALAVSNMILRGDGKTSLYQGSCFDENLINKVKNKATVGFINPPYSQKGKDLHEWDFILQMLNSLEKNAIGIAIVPMSLAISSHPLKETLLKNHRLEAVMSMPNDLFYPVGVVTCIMVFTAYTPHESDPHHESWFGYWKNDGFIKDKREGRIDKNKKWKTIKESWLSMYRKKEIAGMSVWKKIGVNNEWCAEAYLETDYSDLTNKDFERELKNYVAFKIFNDIP